MGFPKSGKSKGKKNVPKAVQKSRKELRKEKRQQKKIGRALYYQEKKRRKESLKKFDKTDPSNVTNEEKSIQSNIILQNNNNREEKKKKKLEKMMREERKRRQTQLKEANAQEDKVIKQLEKRLKIHKRKSKSIPKSFVDDGLDDILEFCDKQDRTCILEAEKLMPESELCEEFEEDLTMAMGLDRDNEKQKIKDMSDNDSYDEDMAEEMDDTEEQEEDEEDVNSDTNTSVESISCKNKKKSKTKTNLVKVDNCEKKKKQVAVESDEEDEFGKIEEMEEMQETEEMSDEDAINTNADDEGIWEDIYGRKRDKKGNILHSNTKYVPPAARATQLASNLPDNENLIRLRKQLKGFLNRLAEHNMHTIVNQVDELYMSNSRNNMNEILSNLMIESLVAPVLTPDRLICEHMLLIAILHANVGVEVGAHFLLTFVRKMDEMLKTTQDVENKELDNVILMISHLYNFKVYGHRLLYQVLDVLSSRFTEKEIELILLILKTVGFPLRKDDPVALKDLILNLQQKASNKMSENARVKYMLDVLLAIKNNNMSKIPQYDPSHVEHLKKLMRTLIRKGNTVTQFNISLEDLLHVDERGKWWVVGSAWTGSDSIEKQMKKGNSNKPMYSQKLLELARKQRMNTDTRRNIFCILMTAEDYLDAFEKLHHLGLKDQQEREIIYVLIDCCLQEKKFNLYYAVIAKKFCDYERRYQMTVQYTLWDKLRELQGLSSSQLSNLARFLTYLFIEKSLSFSVLKVIQFTELDKNTMRLLRQIMLGILLHKDEEACTQVFERISLSPQLHHFRESLRLFINHFLLNNIKSNTTLEVDNELLKARAELIDKILLSRTNKVFF